MFRESIPGVKKSPMALGVPVAYITHNVSSMRPIQLKYGLATSHLIAAGAAGLGESDIHDKVHSIAREETVPSWTMIEWQRNVFDKYLPCAKLFEDPEALDLMKNSEEYSSMSFNHEALKVQDLFSFSFPFMFGGGGISHLFLLRFWPQDKIEDPSEYVKTILSVLRDGEDPPITAVHSKRILKESPFSSPAEIKGVKDLLNQMKTFDPERSNRALKLKGLLKVARISSVMGCVTTLVLCRKKDLPALQDTLVEWAKPIMAAQQLKVQLASRWRAQNLDNLG
jgi:hypothetical protein